MDISAWTFVFEANPVIVKEYIVKKKPKEQLSNVVNFLYYFKMFMGMASNFAALWPFLFKI